jgi:hypothetical protein
VKAGVKLKFERRGVFRTNSHIVFNAFTEVPFSHPRVCLSVSDHEFQSLKKPEGSFVFLDPGRRRGFGAE